MREVKKQRIYPDGKIITKVTMIETDLEDSNDDSDDNSDDDDDDEEEQKEDEDKEEEEDEDKKEDEDKEDEDEDLDPDCRRVIVWKNEDGKNDGQEIMAYIRFVPEIACYKCYQWNRVNDSSGMGDCEVVCTRCHSRLTTLLWEV